MGLNDISVEESPNSRHMGSRNYSDLPRFGVNLSIAHEEEEKKIHSEDEEEKEEEEKQNSKNDELRLQ